MEPASSSERHRSAFRALAVASAVLAVATALGVETATAKVFYARDEMLTLAFPDADDMQATDFLLTDAQKVEIERRARAEVASSLVTFYSGRKAGKVVGYAIVDTHVVRTLPETFLVVLSPEGKVAATHVLAFYEPLDYLPSKRWLDQVHARGLDERLNVGSGIVAITGSTLSSHAVIGSIRRALAAYQVLIEECDSSSQGNGPGIDCSR